MAKELPYFRFEPDAWDHGNIQICSRESKGLFIDLCSFYWSRLGELPYALALQKLCNGNNTALEELKSLEIIGVIDDNIIIEFLDEQLSEFQETSEKRREAANKRWSNASALQKQCKSNAIREENIIEEKRKEYKNTLLSEIFISDFPELNNDYLEIAKSFQLLFKQNLEEKNISSAQIDKAKGSWVDQVRLLIETDKFTIDDCRTIFLFLKHDEFWKSNIQGINKLREKFPQILAKAKSNYQSKNNKDAEMDAYKQRLINDLKDGFAKKNQ